MQPFTRSIINLFDGKKRYLIPLYQRQYAWKPDPQLKLLWEDIERAVDRLNSDRSSLTPHFMGAIVIAQIKTFGKQVQAYEVIDGQQRLTTFQLLLSALRDVAAAHGSSYAEEIQKYLLNDGVMENPEAERFKLWPSLTDRRAFLHIVDPATDLDAVTPRPVDEDGFVRRATSAHAYFKDRIETHVGLAAEFDEHRLELLFEALKEGLAIVSIELEGGDDPQTIFETLNSRGVDLTPGDLLRNYIFQRAKGLGQSDASLVVDKLYEKHWLPLDRAFWSQVESRGRQSRARLDWMLTDHLSMHVGDLVSVENLFESYRLWIIQKSPFGSVAEELQSISTTAEIERRLFEQVKGDPLGDFGRFAHAFDVSTAMPLVVYLCANAESPAELSRGLAVLESYILRRDICGLTTKNYNRLFVGIIDRLRLTEGNQVDALVTYLSGRQSETDRWPDDTEWQQGWLGRDQYKGPRQPRLRYIFEALELAKRSARNEDIDIKSTLTIEHIMPQAWQTSWPLIGIEHLDQFDPERLAREVARQSAVNKLGNLTLLTSVLNSTVSNGPFAVKMPAVRSHSSLALNRELAAYDVWNEDSIGARGSDLFKQAREIWLAPDREDGLSIVSAAWADVSAYRSGLPANGTACRFTYAGKQYTGVIENGALTIEGMAGQHTSFSAASRAVTNTSRNGWNDWHLLLSGDWVLADHWRRKPNDVAAPQEAALPQLAE